MNVIKSIAVDLEIHSPKCLDRICAAFSNTEVSQLSNSECYTGFFANFEADDRGENPESLINRICACIRRFDDQAKEDWFNAYSRVFDIAFQVTSGDIGCNEPLSFDLLKDIVDLKGSINLTFYGRNHYELS